MGLLLTAIVAIASFGLALRSNRKAAREHVLNHDKDWRDQCRMTERTMEAPHPGQGDQ